VAFRRELFQATLRDELEAAWHSLKAAHPDERFYSFGVYTTDVVDYLMVTASTEQGLERATAAYVQKFGGDPALRRAALRWSLGDSPLHAEGEGLLAKSDALRLEGPDPYADTAEAEAVLAAVYEDAIGALKLLDRRGVFGVADEREKLLLGIWKGDQSDEERVEFARLLNDAASVERFGRELEAGDQAFDELSRAR